MISNIFFFLFRRYTGGVRDVLPILRLACMMLRYQRELRHICPQRIEQHLKSDLPLSRAWMVNRSLVLFLCDAVHLVSPRKRRQRLNFQDVNFSYLMVSDVCLYWVHFSFQDYQRLCVTPWQQRRMMPTIVHHQCALNLMKSTHSVVLPLSNSHLREQI